MKSSMNGSNQKNNWIALKRITINQTGQIIEKHYPFPNDIDNLDYNDLENQGFIINEENYFKNGFPVCMTCG